MTKTISRILCCFMVTVLCVSMVACDVSTDSLIGKLLGVVNDAPAYDQELDTLDQVIEAVTNQVTATERVDEYESVDAPMTDVPPQTELEEIPSVEVETETVTETVEQTTKAPELVNVYVDVWDDQDGTHSPLMIGESHQGAGIVITIPEGGYLSEVSIQAPGYGDNFGSLSIKVFAWEGDYEATVSTAPYVSHHFVDFPDNSTLVCAYDKQEQEMLGAGRYLILVCDGSDAQGEGVGVWMGKALRGSTMPEEYAKYEIESWVNGKQNKKTIGKFSLVIVEPEQ